MLMKWHKSQLLVRKDWDEFVFEGTISSNDAKFDLYKEQYNITLRRSFIEEGNNKWKTYYYVQQAKLECYFPEKIISMTDTLVQINLNGVLMVLLAKSSI